MSTANILPDGVPMGEMEDWYEEPIQSEGSSPLCVDNGTVLGSHTPEDTSYLYASANTVTTAVGFGDTPSDVGTVTAITVNIRAKLEDPSSAAYIELYLFHSEGTAVSGNPKTVTGTDLGAYGTLGECYKTWSGLSLTKAEVDSLFLRMVYYTGD